MKILITGIKYTTEAVKYGYNITCEAVEGTEDKIFCYKSADDTYGHIATFYDLNTYPITRVEAIELGKLYYRRNTMNIEFTTMSDAMEFEEYLLYASRQLVYDVNKVNGAEFPGSFTILVGD